MPRFAVVMVAILIPQLAFVRLLGFEPLPAGFYLIGYVVAAELAKVVFYRKARKSIDV